MNTVKERAYMKKYMKRRYHNRRQKALEFLGGKCVACEERERLEIDHIDPRQKTFDISKMWSCSEEKFWKEIEKCQLLCQKHHNQKTIEQRGQKSARGKHGTLSSRRYCDCSECKRAKALYMKIYKDR
jgi:hypothetical protein